MYGWVSGSTSGFTRSATGARTPVSRATSSSARSSLSDSTLNMRTSALSASRSSSRVLPTPEKMILPGGKPARSARKSSPPDTMSAPAPARERAEHAEIPVGLDRVADDVRDLGEGVVVAPVALQQGRLRVDVGGRADVGGEEAQRHLLAAEVGVAVGEVSHVTFVRSIHAG